MRVKSFVVGVLLFGALLHAQMHQLKMDEAIELALKHSPDINQSVLNVKSFKQQSKMQEGYYLPQVDLGLVAGKGYINFNQKILNVDKIDNSGIVGSLNASQLLYDFGKTGGRIDAARLDVKAQEAKLKKAVARKILDVKVHYYDLLKAKSIIDVNEKDIELQKEQLRRAKRYFEAGIRTLIDVSDAKVHLKEAQLTLNNSRYDLKLKRATFEQTLGMTPYAGEYDLVYKERNWFEGNDIESSLPKVTEALDELIGYAYRHRHELFVINYSIESAKERIRSSKGEYYPSLYLNADYSKLSLNDDDPSLQLESIWNAGVALNWNLFRGFQSEAAVEKAKIERLSAQTKRERLKLQIKREVVQAYLEVARTKDAIALSKEVANASEQKFDQAQKRYEHGLSDYIELQDARQGYIRSLNHLVIAYYDYFIALAKLDYAIGK